MALLKGKSWSSNCGSLWQTEFILVPCTLFFVLPFNSCLGSNILYYQEFLTFGESNLIEILCTAMIKRTELNSIKNCNN